jgi:hypothetical protein
MLFCDVPPPLRMRTQENIEFLDLQLDQALNIHGSSPV